MPHRPSRASSVPADAPAVADPVADAPVEDGGPLSVECPHCGAEAGSPCVTSKGKETDPHKARVEAAG